MGSSLASSSPTPTPAGPEATARDPLSIPSDVTTSTECVALTSLGIDSGSRAVASGPARRRSGRRCKRTAHADSP